MNANSQDSKIRSKFFGPLNPQIDTSPLFLPPCPQVDPDFALMDGNSSFRFWIALSVDLCFRSAKINFLTLKRIRCKQQQLYWQKDDKYSIHPYFPIKNKTSNHDFPLKVDEGYFPKWMNRMVNSIFRRNPTEILWKNLFNDFCTNYSFESPRESVSMLHWILFSSETRIP